MDSLHLSSDSINSFRKAYQSKKGFKRLDLKVKIAKPTNEQDDEEDDEFCYRDDLLPICFQSLRHFEEIKGIEVDDENGNWRIRDKNNKMKTVSVALVLCLNIGVDPPDVMKIHPCSRVECWIDPTTLSAPKALELIGSNLQKQYERWQPRARYKKSPDPTADDIKKLCTSLRRNAKEERVLFHYNGHGVPLPTANGEIWVFNKNYTQYIPLSIYDLQTWMGAPSIYVYDCSHAGIIVKSFIQFAKQHEEEIQKHANINMTDCGDQHSTEGQYTPFSNCIQLAACSENEILPMNPQLPADLFTSCLTTPIKMALKWYTMQQGQGKMVLAPSINGELIDKIPGQIADRRTMLGELNWIFTAITDTIAWNTLDRDLFQKLFRQDLLVASLFRNFLLAERILRHHDCTPVSSPVLPQCFRHPMWAAWDLAVDLALQQLPDILEKNVPYKQSPFFEEQLTAFQVWLNRASDKRTPPEQLPIVLQVLLSQVHRLRALELLGRFLDSGPWAVHLALGVGIFPYVLKLLQSAASELKPVLVHIWAKILAVDSMCQVDLYKHNKYFISVLQDTTVCKETRTLAVFVLSSIVNNFKEGQKSALQDSLLSICLVQLNDEDPQFRQWVIICLGLLWQNFAEARWSGARDMAYEKLTDCLNDPVAEVRAAAVFALGTFISSVTNRTEEQANNIDRLISTNLLKIVGEDMSPLVRLELVGALQWMVLLFESHFVSVFIPEFTEIKKNLRPGNNIALLPQMNTKDIVTSLIWDNHFSRHQTHSLERNFMRRGFSSNSFNNISMAASTSSPCHGSSNIPYGSMFLKLWQGICNLARDPYPKVSEAACLLLEHVTNKTEIASITAKEATVIEKCSTSVSLPPSPNTRSHFLGDSPPQRDSPNNSMIYGSAGTRKDTIMGRNGVEMSMSVQQPKMIRSSMQESVGDSNNPIKPLVITNYIPWCISQFARPTRRLISEDGTSTDKHSELNRARVSRFKRNENIRKIAVDQQSRAMHIRIDTPMVNFKTQFTPYIIKMFPYESSIAVAYRDKVVVRDLNDLSSYDCNPNLHNLASSRFSFDLTNISRVSTMEFINAHDKPMILVGHDNGMIRIWQENNKCENQREYKLVSAWMGLPFLSSNTSSSRNMGGSSNQGMISTWHQRSQHLIVGDHIVNGSCGPMRYLRIWDAKTELKLVDLPTNAESNLRVLSSGPSEIIAAGYGNGSISLFDKRLPPNECRIRTFREHSSSILTICLRDRAESMISGCTQGKINLFDIRSHRSPPSWKVGSDVITAISVHSAADIVACGSSNNIKIFGLDGKTLTSLKPYEGLLSTRLGQPSCLAFHPHKINLSAGYLDNTVYVYGSSGLTSKGG